MNADSIKRVPMKGSLWNFSASGSSVHDSAYTCIGTPVLRREPLLHTCLENSEFNDISRDKQGSTIERRNPNPCRRRNSKGLGSKKYLHAMVLLSQGMVNDA
jgi:hypothetical protein